MKTKTNMNGGLLALAWAFLMVFVPPPLRAQFIYQDVYDFDCSIRGCEPQDNGQLMQWSDGNLYGTTFLGGANDDGSIFAATPSVPGGASDVWTFDGITGGGDPAAALTLAPDGSFYGTTDTGGTFGYGSVFLFTPPGGVKSLIPLHYFNGTDGQDAETPPIQARDGNFYGVTGSGTTYRVTYPAGAFNQLLGVAPSAPSGPLVAGLDGNLYGTTFAGGTSNMGTIFKMTTAGAIIILHNFSGTDGATPEGLVQESDGNLYGTTSSGGANNTGEIFQLTLPGHKLNTLYSFPSVNPSTGQNSDGAGPLAGLLAASDGYLYGSSGFGGVNACGTLFRITTKGSFFKLADFPNWDCSYIGSPEPNSVLVQHTNGSLFGTTYFGGTNGSGNVYTLTPTTPYHTVKVEGPVWVKPGVPVEILGDNLTHAIQVTFAGEQAQFQAGSDTYLTATVPSDAVDGLIAVILDSGLQIESQSAVRILPVITNLDPTSGPPGTQVGIAGGGFAGAKKVTFGGVKATNFTVASPTLIQAIVPAGARTGKVVVTTPNSSARSKQTFTVN